MVTDHKILPCESSFLIGTHFIVPDKFQTDGLFSTVPHLDDCGGFTACECIH